MQTELENAAPALPAEQATPEDSIKVSGSPPARPSSHFQHQGTFKVREHYPAHPQGAGVSFTSKRTSKWRNDEGELFRLIRKGSRPSKEGLTDAAERAEPLMLDYASRNENPLLCDITTREEINAVEWSRLEMKRIRESYETCFQTQWERAHLYHTTKLRKAKRHSFKLSAADIENALRRNLTAEERADLLGKQQSISSETRLLIGGSKTSFKELMRANTADFEKWNKHLLELGMPEKAQPHSFAPPETTQSKDSEVARVVSEWQQKIQSGEVILEEFNDVEELTRQQREDFSKDAVYMVSLESGVTRQEAISNAGLQTTPDALRKAAKRVRNPKLNWSKVAGHYFIVVVLNGKPELKRLAPEGADSTTIWKAWIHERHKTVYAAHKREKRLSPKKTLQERLQKATERIHIAYSKSWVSLAPEDGGTEEMRRNWLNTESLRLEIGAEG